jgi:NADH-quinone oxidoreductase subunit L
MLGAATLAADAAHTASLGGAVASGGGFLFWAILLPAISSVLCAGCLALGVRSKLPAWITFASLAASFVVVAIGYGKFGADAGAHSATLFNWIELSWGSGPGQTLSAPFSIYIDSLTLLWMLFVTGLSTLIALYASEYMAGDKGYARFFSAFSLFVFAMSCLVMGGNMLMLFLGWEGVGLCSYLLIGYFYTKPSAVAAAKKAFVMNRIGDFGLLVGMMLTFVHFGTLEFEGIFNGVAALQQSVEAGGEVPTTVRWIPYLLALGAFGKSAQLPLYVWLPDAMEGPTPVSALIHAATMVTAGVYLIARMLPVFALEPSALTLVAWVGGLTALVAATIGMAVFDIKRVMAYSTVSQLGYMFLGLGVLSQGGAAYHVFTHAFFKATLFLACGAVMHGMAGQLDLRKLSGLMKVPGWKITGIALLAGCLCLAGFPFTSGFFSKDMIIAEAFVTQGPGFQLLGLLALLTAGMTAYYSFRVFFRVFMGPVHFEPGDDDHGAHDDHGHDDAHAGDDHGFHPHAPGWAINLVLIVLTVGSFAAAIPYFMGDHGWASDMVGRSTAAGVVLPEGSSVHYLEPHEGETEAHASFFGLGDPHKVMYFVSGIIGLIGIGIAYWLHLAGRTEAATSRADALKKRLGGLGKAAENKWYVDEIYNAVIRVPLLVLAHIFALLDKVLIDGLVDLFGRLPHFFGRLIRPSQGGVLQGYAVGMGSGLAALVLLAWMVGAQFNPLTSVMDLLRSIFSLLLATGGLL